MRSSILLVCFLFVLSESTEVVQGANTKRPNIIFIIADDMHRHMFNCLPEGKGRNLTPNLDRLASEGTLLMGQHVASPVCTPSRYSCLTGLYASRSRCERFIRNTRREGQTVVQWNAHITDEETLPQLLHQAGYVTGFVGKNHVIGADVEKVSYKADPTQAIVAAKLQKRQTVVEAAIHGVGFDYVASVYHENPDGNGPRELGVHNLDWTTDGALKFIDANHEKPFFLYYATTTPHGPGEKDRSWNADPTATPTGYLEQPLNVLPPRETIPQRLKEAGLPTDPQRCNLLWMDDSIGAILAKLEQKQIDDNTIILFFNDHGQSAKGTLYQGGVTNPSVIWRKGGFPCGAVNQALLSNIDFAPTLLDIADVSYNVDQFDGRSFQKILCGQTETIHDSLYFEMGYSRAVLKDGWKYLALRYPKSAESMPISQRQEILDQFNAKQKLRGRPIHNTDPQTPFSHVSLIPGGGDAEAVSTGKRPGYYDRDQLYQLGSDPQENDNLANDPKHTAKLTKLKQELRQFLKELPGNFAELKTNASSN